MSGEGFTLLSGIEVDILDDGALDQEPELLDGSTSWWPRRTRSCGWSAGR